MKKLPLVLCLLLLLPAGAVAQDDAIKIATWNIEHLRAEENQGNVRRTEADFARLKRYVDRLDADVVALQEVDGPEAAARIFDPAVYDFFFSRRDNVQRTGFAIKKTLSVIQHPDFEALDVGGVRRGTDVSVMIDGQEVRLLSVHLKSGCFDRPMTSDTDACQKLARQLPVLEEWIDARAREGTPFAVLGDFNRRFDAPGDTFYPEIDDADPPNADLERVTEGRRSDCLNGRYPLYIDHILLDRSATAWLVAGSFEQLVYDAVDEPFEDKLSDHCPIAVRLDPTPTAGPVPARPTLQELLARIDAIEAELHLLRSLLRTALDE